MLKKIDRKKIYVKNLTYLYNQHFMITKLEVAATDKRLIQDEHECIVLLLSDHTRIKNKIGIQLVIHALHPFIHITKSLMHLID